jgi:hypothetical protein
MTKIRRNVHAARIRSCAFSGCSCPQKMSPIRGRVALAVAFVLVTAVFFQPPVSTTSREQGILADSQESYAAPMERDNNNNKPIKVAYAISLIECTDNHKSGHSSKAGLQDASIVMRHSIHQNSVRNPSSGSNYDYEMYAIIHEQAKACASVLQDAGFITLIRDPPILEKDIQDEYLRENIHKEVCCGVHEFVKLYAYLIPAPVVVHLDIDFIFAKPMDAVFDVMLGSTDKATRALVEREDSTAPWPDNIEAMITRDYHSSYPGRNAGFQAGFWVLKPSKKHFENLLNIIRTEKYVGNFEPNNGWGGKGCK